VIQGAPTLEKLQPQAGQSGPGVPAGPGFFRGPGGGAGGGSGRNGDAAAMSSATAVTIGVWLLVGAIVILFAAFTSTFLTRRAEADWRVGPLPPVLWANTLILLASSAAMEWARAGGRRGRLDVLRLGVAMTTVLGAAFLVGQVMAWRQLVANGIGLASTAHSAFFYLLTGAHGLHLAGGVAALSYALWKVRRAATAAAASDVVTPTAIYWHFVDGLWLYVFLILFWA
jgi:cytochrome c oxidase subunit 3